MTLPVAISMALVSSHTIPLLLELNKAGKINTNELITHGKLSVNPFALRSPLTCHRPDFKFSEIEKAYDTFGRAAETKALKMNIEFD